MNPKFASAREGTPVSIGIGTNIQATKQLQIIPEINLATNETAGTNVTLAPPWPPTTSTALDLYVSNAAGLTSVGQLLENIDQTCFSARFSIQL